MINTGTSASPNYQCQKTGTPACSPTSYGYNSTAGVCSFTPTPTNCPAGYTGTGSGTTLVCSKPVTATPTCSPGTYSASTGLCVVVPPTPACSTSGYSLTNTGTSAAPTYQCAGYTTVAASCSSGTFSSTTGQCTVTGTATKNFFQYSTGPATGPYVTYYVASAAQGCVNIPHSSTNCVDENDVSGVSAPAGVKAGQNVANWFSYYRSRILTAKSGLTSAFDKLDPSSRLGFASINGNKNTLLPGTPYTNGGVSVSNVAAFDNSCVTSTTSPCAKGQTGTTRASFWNWVTKETVTGGTALRSALNALGQYYSQNGPWQNSSTDTTKLACRQSYAIATTDGFWNDPTPPSPGNVDNTAGTQVTGPNGQDYTYVAVAPFKDSTSNTLADVALKYWATDLQPTLDNEVPTGSADPAFWQHMTTFTLGLGFVPKNITPVGTTIDQIFVWANGADSSTGTVVNSNIPTDFAWPAPASNSINNIADLAHAGVNGRGGFYSATSPKAFADGIADAINRVQTRVGTGASLAANSTKLGVGTVTYQALYYTRKWNGDLKAYNVDPTTGAIATSATWSASTAMPSAASRNIMTYNPSGTTSATKYVAFSDPDSLSTAQKSALGATTVARQNIINYLRGDSSLETNHAGGTLRQRSSPLGDIINSQPVYVGAPNPNLFYGKTFNGSSSYPTFAADKVSRAPVIWVAANDGMLHAFQTTDGAEVFAYLPGSVITSGLSDLSNPNYGGTAVPHQLYNDGEMTVADVYTTLPSGTTAAWRTVLVGSTGRGPAKTLYALDITDATAPIFLWERSAADGLTNSGYIGQITGQPVIAQTANGTWSVLTGNGYNSAQNKAAMLQFDLMSGALTVHTTSTTTDNGLAAPVAWIGTLANNISTIAYAGDLKGKVWSFSLYDETTLAATPSSTGSLIFSATDGTKAQPITAGLLAGKDPKTGNLWLFFGTGQYFTQTDLDNRDVQTWYGIIVKSADSTLVPNLAAWTGNRTSSSSNALVPRSITAQRDATSSTLAARTVTVPTDGDMVGKSGWFLDLVKPPSTAQGERMVTPNQFQGSLLLGTSRVPIVSDACNPSGSGWIMALNPFTGGNPLAAFFDLNSDQLFNSGDKIDGIAAAGIGFGSVANNPIFVGNTMLTSFDNGTISSIDTAGTVGAVARLSWRELVTH
ncbi:pilus assembly protein [Stenotrophobium rhamnosiphilum]|uniref:pilus assembly protein n=1 Tax=Stenotrophobium rhamnosiphilum TaxID=2029166 RepID=UPI0013750B90|nr:PilC/PilY family type IV pilus protein [Stenotrophobium rhamnosiphilum]